jgi:protoporphyrinogen/coproporphyrinogen III oxidase
VKHVAIIGGGLAGLTCAFHLKRRGIEATVFESRSKAGGRDTAALYLLAPDLFRDTFQLIRDLDLTDDIISISPHAGQAYRGRVYHHRVASATGLLSFKGLGFTDKALLGRMAYLLARYSAHLDFHHPERGLEFDDETVASFIKRELSQNVLNYVAGPLISTLFFFGSEETSRWLYLVLAKHMFNTCMSTLRGGIGRLAERLAEHCRILTNETIHTVAVDGDGYFLDGRLFSDIVVAVSGNHVLQIAGMEGLLSGVDRQFFQECAYQRTVSVAVSTEKPIDGNCYAVSIPRVEGYAAATISFLDYIDPASVSDGRGLLIITGGGPTVTPARLLEDLRNLYSIEAQAGNVTEWISGMPMFPPGRYRHIHEFQRRARRPGLFFCGDYLSGPFIEGAIATGLRAAEAIPL